MQSRLWVALAAAFTLVAVASIGPGSASSQTPSKFILFSSDGMRPDLVDKFAADLPTLSSLSASGVKGDNGLTQAFPPNTGVGWHTLATGTGPSEHGSTNNTFHRTGASFTSRTRFSDSGVLQADHIATAAVRAGKKVAQLDWVGGRAAAEQIKAQGLDVPPTKDFLNFFSRRGVVRKPFVQAEKNGADAFGLQYQIPAIETAKGWKNVPASDKKAPAQQTVLQVPTTSSANPSRTYDIFIFDADTNGVKDYDHALLVRSADNKDGNKAVVTLAVGDFEPIKLTGSDGLIGSRAGQSAGFYVKLITLTPDLSEFKLYFTSVARAIALCGSACNGLPAGGAGEDRLEKFIADTFDPAISNDFAPVEAGIVDEETHVQQAVDLADAVDDAVLEFVLGTLQPNTDLGLIGYEATDGISHQYMGLITPTEFDGTANPFFDDLNGDGTKDNRVGVREGFIRSAYEGADAKLGLARQLMGGNPTAFASSDHGFAAHHEGINAQKILTDASAGGVSLHASGIESNCGAASSDLAKACWAGGTVQIYVNPSPPTGSPSFAAVKAAAVAAFQDLTDPRFPGRQVIDVVLTKEQLRNVDGSDSLHPNRSGDVAVASLPPYQFDGAPAGQRIGFAQFFGQHGFRPDLVKLSANVNMHATFIAGGPGIASGKTLKGVRAIDVAPTLAYLMGIPGPQNASGKILYDALPNAAALREATILDISDYHGQLIPLRERADTVGPEFAIGGAAFLKPWFDVFRAEARDGSITVAGGDSIGATPPISSFFDDKPTIELMNLMGFAADGLGNHNFDKGQKFFREEIVPLATFKYLSANILNPKTDDTPKEWLKSRTFDFGGFKLAVVGFSNPDIPELTKPGSLDPFVVTDPPAAVNKRTVQVRTDGADGVVALGHMGATSGTLANPAGPLIALADGAVGVDAVIGDHTNFQVLATRPNGVLVTENLSKGVRITRVRIVFDTATGKVVYKTADFHKPWNIGVTPDPQIQTRIDELSAQLAPILGTVIGSSTVEVPRSDACGNADGRTCESKVGNAVTDAMRATYGVDFAITNSGGLRKSLTCPPGGGGDGFCPSFTPPPWLITRGQVLAVLPFGNVVVTLTVNGAELKSMLENGVSTMPSVSGRFPQVSGLCFTYNINAPAGSRVVGAVRQAADGSCTGAAVDLTAASTFTIAENDFMVTGGDGYPNFASRATSRDVMDQVVADHISANTPISPAIQGRIVCTGSTCPVVTP